MHRIIISTTLVGALLLAATPALSDDTPITSSMRLDADAKRDVGDRCQYATSIHGTVTPVKSSNGNDAKGKSASEVEPRIDVQATLTCPDTEAVKITDNVMTTGSLTRDQLLRALERRATVVAARAKGRCVYVPELTLTGTELKLQSVTSSCTK